jgi:hypothetical protein
MKHIGLITFLALAIVFNACDRSDAVSGTAVRVQIRSLQVAEGDSEDLARSASTKEAETVSTPLGDGLLLEMSMERDESPLRATLALKTGAHFRVIAVKTGTSTYVSHGDFTVGGATTDDDFLVESYVSNYDFICISYNDAVNPLPAFSPAQGTDLSATTYNLTNNLTGLLWWKETNVPVTTTDPALSITLNYLVAKLKVLVDCSYNEWLITVVGNMTLGTAALAQSVGLTSGSVTGSSVTNQTVTWPAMMSESEQQLSNPLAVLAKTSSTLTVTLPVNVITRKEFNPIPTIANSGKFDTNLAVGKSYTLRLKLRAPKWAGSNIYWSGNGLKFDEYVSDGSKAPNRGGQGVVFKFGSLVGVSPATTWVNNSTPTYDANATTASTHSTWSNIISWEIGRYGNTINDEHYDALMGDICRYLSKDVYRLPKFAEMLAVNTVNWNGVNPVGGGWVPQGSAGDAGDTGNESGTYNMIDNGYFYVRNNTMGNVTLPASGWYSRNCYDVGSEGRYWCDETVRPSNDYVYSLRFDDSKIYRVNESIGYACPVRCVLN